MKKIILIAMLITLAYFYSTKTSEILIPKEAIRFRIIANSDSSNDQEIKQLIKDNIEPVIIYDLNNNTNIVDARNTLINNKQKYKTLIDKLLEENNINTPVDINYGSNYFPEKTYKGVKYEEGNYESLVITLGTGLGKNWWCVLFPPLCILDEKETEEVEYKFFVKELIDKIFN